MTTQLVDQIRAVQTELDPQFKALRGVMSALAQAAALAAAEKPDALAMQKTAVKLQQAATAVPNTALAEAVTRFSAETQTALDALAFSFAGNLRDALAQRGITLEGRPPTLTAGDLMLQLDSSARKGQWFYGKEPLTRPLPLSLGVLVKAYEQWARQISGRKLDDPVALLREIEAAWQKCLEKRARIRGSKRINIIEVYSELVMSRQSGRFWNSPSRQFFKDYERHFFVRDLVLLQAAGATLPGDGQARQLRLGVATKSQADQATRSLWLPDSPLDGQYYSDLTFEEA